LLAGAGSHDDHGAHLFDPLTHAALPELVARYRVVREIARGGMGVILAATDPEQGRDVAIKLMLPNHLGRAGYRERFVEEARITVALHHPGIVTVYEVGELPDTRPFFAMELVAGETLDAQLDARKHPSDDMPQFLQVFGRVCEAIAYAHGRGVLHRDLKPLNVMVAPCGAVKVMDWGVSIVMRASDSLPKTEDRKPAARHPAADTEVIGTPAYMSPEQAQGTGRGIDERTDVFGLGGILCAILTGHPPYTGNRTRKVHARAARADLAECFGRLDAAPAPREVIALAKRCLAPHQFARPQNASEVADAVAACGSHGGA
jgi:serine/threonine protein kinase